MTTVALSSPVQQAGAAATEATFGAAEWLEFAGHLHPLLLHLPIGLLLGVTLLEVVAKVDRRTVTARRALYLVFGLSALVAAGTGWLLGGGVDYQGAAVDQHRQFGIAAGVAAILTALFDVFGRSKLFALLRIVGLIVCGVLFTVAGHRGGMMTHGQRFLSEKAPPWLAPYVGPAPRARVDAELASVTPETQTLAEDVETDGVPTMPILGAGATGENGVDVVETPGPAIAGESLSDLALVVEAFRAQCFECHCEDKVKGGLRLDEAHPWAGCVDPDSPLDSEFLYRVHLPADDPDAMPPKGDRMEPKAVEALQRWIEAGAPMEELESLLQQGAKVSAAAGDVLAAVKLTSGAVLTPLPEDSGLPPENVRLVASWAFSGTPVSAERLAALAPLGARLTELRLQGTAVTDAVLAGLPELPALRTVHLERTAVGDEGALLVARRAPGLEVLNLHSTSVTAAGAAAVQACIPTARLVLFGTAADTAAPVTLPDRSEPDLPADGR